MARLRGGGGCPWDREQTRARSSHTLSRRPTRSLEAINEGVRPPRGRAGRPALSGRVSLSGRPRSGRIHDGRRPRSALRQDGPPPPPRLRRSRRSPTRARRSAVGADQARRRKEDGQPRSALTACRTPAGAPPGTAASGQRPVAWDSTGRSGGRHGQGPRGDRGAGGSARSRRGPAGQDELGDVLFSMVNVARL